MIIAFEEWAERFETYDHGEFADEYAFFLGVEWKLFGSQGE